MKDSTRRAIRSSIDTLIAGTVVAVAAVPLLGLEPARGAAIVATLTAANAFISKVKNTLEDSGVLTPVLKGDPPSGG